MRRLALLLISALLLPLAAGANARTVGNAAITDSLYRKLHNTQNPKLRLAMLYDIFDLAPQDSVNATGQRVLEAAREAHDTAAIYDMYRRLASFNQAKDTTLIRKYLNEISQMPETPERNASKTFVYLCALISQANYAKESERFSRISELIKLYNSLPEDSGNERRLVMLYTLCKYLDLTMPSYALTDYLGELETLINNQPYQLDALKNMFYLNAAMIYTNNDQPAQAIAADRNLLKIIGDLERKAKTDGHRYRSYDKFRYTVYRRMLSNYEALGPDEIEPLYNEIRKLRNRMPEIDRDMRENPHAVAYYLMAKERYSQAKEPLKRAIDTETRFSTRLRLYKFLAKAAEKDGDTELLNRTLKTYNQMLEETLRQRTLERARQVSLLYGIGLDPETFNAENSGESEEDSERHTLYIVTLVTALGLLLIVSILLLVLYRRSHSLSRKLLDTNDLLTAERDNLKRTQTDLIAARDEARKANRHKSDFINNMSHEVSTPLNSIIECSHLIVDNAAAEKKPYLERFAKTIDISADMLRTLINDVLEINNLEGNSLVVQRTNVSVQALCMAAIESVKKHVPKGVDLIWANAGQPDTTIFTDAGRVEQVIINMLSNGLKFTESGFVKFEYVIDQKAGTTSFIVTDSGIGVPEGKEDIIFGRFEKLSPMDPGSGLGLSISRMIANLLHGHIYVDTTYKEQGSRFIFTIPSKP